MNSIYRIVVHPASGVSMDEVFLAASELKRRMNCIVEVCFNDTIFAIDLQPTYTATEVAEEVTNRTPKGKQ